MAFTHAGTQVPPTDAADETAAAVDRVNAVNLRGVRAGDEARTAADARAAVCPGVIDTPRVACMLEGQAEAMAAIMKDRPIGRPGRADQVAAAVLWLCSPGAGFVIGTARPVDGGFTVHQ